MYTSGTTGKPKGRDPQPPGRRHALPRHRDRARLCAATTRALLVMPMCHANSLYFFGAFAYCGAACTVYSRKSFDPEHLVRTLAEGGATFTSLVPTHYIMMLGLPARRARTVQRRRGHQADDLLGAGAADTKLAIMEMFRNSGLFELYGSTEAGWVTMLHPRRAVHQARLGRARMRRLAPDPAARRDGNDVPDGEVGELYSCNPYTFDGYWKLPEKTREAFRGDYCTVGDMARRDADGYIHLVDRKSNMIISGGENIYPSEVEALLGSHPAVQDVAVIGLPDAKWGERVHAVIVLRDGACADRGRAASNGAETASPATSGRAPVASSRDEEMPRTATGKILHRMLRMQHRPQAPPT